LVQLQQIVEEVRNRAIETVFYELDLSKETEPVDSLDFVEFEEEQGFEHISSSLRDVLRPNKRYFAVVGPDLSDLSSMKNLDIKIATISPSKS